MNRFTVYTLSGLVDRKGLEHIIATMASKGFNVMVSDTRSETGLPKYLLVESELGAQPGFAFLEAADGKVYLNVPRIETHYFKPITPAYFEDNLDRPINFQTLGIAHQKLAEVIKAGAAKANREPTNSYALEIYRAYCVVASHSRGKIKVAIPADFDPPMFPPLVAYLAIQGLVDLTEVPSTHKQAIDSACKDLHEEIFLKQVGARGRKA